MFKGKAGSLAYLKSLELNVPDYQVIEHDQLVSWGNSESYDVLINSFSFNDFKKTLQSAENFIATVKVPNLKLRNDCAYAVRSSALTEDSPENSFAGIFETQLFVKDISSSVKNVWLSLFQPKSLQYCLDRQVPWTLLKMDVVIQEMINGDKSGILFQANPMGKISEQIIVAGYGLGQGVVDEESDTDRYVIENFEIKEKSFSIKKKYLTFVDDKIVKALLPPDKQNASVLSQGEIEKLLTASVIMSIHSEHFLDVEFTFKDSILYILQARPITTLAAKKFTQVFDNSNIAENYPGQSLPLTYTGLARGYSANFKNLIRFVGLKDEDWSYINKDLDQLVGYWGGQIYYNLNSWYAIYTLLPFGAEKAVRSFNEMVGITSESQLKIPDRSLIKKLSILFKILPRFLSFYFQNKLHHKNYKEDFGKLKKDFDRDIETATSSYEIIYLIRQLDSRYLAIIKIPLFNDFFSSILNRACRMLGKRLDLEKGEFLYNDLLSNREALESSRAIYSLIELAEEVQFTPGLEEYLKSTHLPHPQYESFFLKLQNHFDLYGDRSQWEMKIEVPTARETPEITLKLILEYAAARMTSQSQREKQRAKSEKADTAFKELGWKKPFTFMLFRLLFEKCTTALAFREDSRFDRVRFKGLSRILILKLGRVLTEKKWLLRPEDIFYLTYDEIISFVHDSYGPAYWKDLVSLRKSHLDNLKSLRLPDRILSNELISARAFHTSDDSESGSFVRGIPCSGGIVETECEVVIDLNVSPPLAGKILVAERTDPAWGYFFVGVKGIIIEKGSMLSHAAIISRELGIPCIINVKNATKIFKSGMKVKMNGETGEIEIISGA